MARILQNKHLSGVEANYFNLTKNIYVKWFMLLQLSQYFMYDTNFLSMQVRA